ncbi:MAG: hypothetical protein VX694_16920 [Planctomycetota bacterium]|nr:hypothetical protein [Planctomycetota bacterium]MEC7680959.1 hypothetical protein [Planctomycetota bacterium]
MLKKKAGKSRCRTHIPTQEQIEARTASIRSRWSDVVKHRRQNRREQSWTPPRINLAEIDVLFDQLS